MSSPTQHVTTLGVSCARVIILTHDLSMLAKRLASYNEQKRKTINSPVKVKRRRQPRGKILAGIKKSNQTGLSRERKTLRKEVNMGYHCLLREAIHFIKLQITLQGEFSSKEWKESGTFWYRKRQWLHAAELDCNFWTFWLVLFASGISHLW